MDITTTVTLNNGIEMPLLGLGTYLSDDGKPVEKSVGWAIQEGYRAVDTASVYGNERGVGAAIAAADISRDEMFITSKLWNSDQGYESTHSAFEKTLKRLGTDYLDLYLIHWPRPVLLSETWRAMEEIYSSGAVRAIGVSNFLTHHLEQLDTVATVPPTVNQIEHHPRLQQHQLLQACQDRSIVVTAWSPLMQGRVTEIPEIANIGTAVGATAAQVTLRWMLERGVITIPKSVKQERIRENADLYGFSLSEDQMLQIAALDIGERLGPHPDIFPGA